MFNEQQLNTLHQYAYSLTRNPDNAYDLVYTCLERYLRQASPKQEAMAYIKRSIKNAFIDQLKSSSHQREVFIDDALNSHQDKQEPNSGSAMDNLVGLDTANLDDLMINEQEIAAFTEQLNADENELLYYWAVEGYTVQELADQMGKPKGTLLSKLHRIRKKAELYIMAKNNPPTAVYQFRSNQ